MKKCIAAVGIVGAAAATPFLLSGFLRAEAQKTAVPKMPDRTAVLTDVKHGGSFTLFKPCSRPAPDAVSFWTPTPNDTQAAEQVLPAFIQSLKQQGPNRHLGNDFRQYAGFIGKNHHKYLYLNGFSPSIKEETERAAKIQKRPFDWKRDPLVVCDGGDQFWGAEYDTQTKQWGHFYFNGR